MTPTSLVSRASLGGLALLFIAVACGSSDSDSGGSSSPPDSGTDAGGDTSATDGGGVTDASGTDAPADTAIACGARTKQRAVASHVTIPQSKADFALDLNGDGKADNQYGNIVAAFTAQNINEQGALDAAVANGDDIVLLEESSVDATFTIDLGCAIGSILAGVAKASPDYSGAGTFTVDGAVSPAALNGAIASSVFESPAAPGASDAPIIKLKVPFAGALVTVPIYAARVQIKSVAGHATSAQLNGGIKATDLQTVVIPAIAAGLTAKVTADPNSDSSKQIEQIFDVGDGMGGSCTNAGAAPGVPNDGVISTCEVAGNSIIKTLFNPDVQLFDAAGKYHPNAANTTKDSLSIGLSFTLVGAQF